MFGRAISARGGTTRKHWSRFFVLLTVLGVFAFAASLRSASPATAEAPKPVEVVNVPTVNAQQSGSWNVGINANVNIGNVPSNPVPVRVVDNATRQPFQTGCPAGISGGSRHGEGSFTVPADKRLVIEHSSIP